MDIGVKQAANLLNVSEKTVYRWVSEKQIPFFRVGSRYRFSREMLLQWVRGNQARAVMDTEDESITASLEECLRAGGIFYRVGGENVRDVLEQMLSLIKLPAEADKEQIFDSVYQRELIASTAIGEGIALPHCRDLALPGVSHPLIALGFLDQPVDFGAIDNMPVSTVFLLLSPSALSSIRVMARLAYAVRQPEVALLLTDTASRDRILKAVADVDRQLKEHETAQSRGPER